MTSNHKMLAAAIAVGLVFLAGCTPPGPVLTPLEIQSLQTREYDHDKAIVFASAMSVFQDLGYVVNSADLNTGLITAESPAASDRAAFPARLAILPDLMVWSDVTSVVQTRATAFIEQIGTRSRVRLNFVVTRQASSVHGQTSRQDTPILDAAVYQNAFERIENAIFVRAGN
jgi:hypothetical protein